MTVGRAPVGVEARSQLRRSGTAGAGSGRVARFLKPFAAASQRLGLHELRVIMIPALLLPDVERTLARVRHDEVQIADDEFQHRGSEGLVQARLGVPPARER